MDSGLKTTPKGRKNKTGSTDSPGSPYMSPLSVTPGRSPSQGNLTGSARKVKDTVADWHNYIDRWHAYNGQASSHVSQIANIKMKAVFSKEEGDEEDTKHDSNEMPVEMESHCIKLATKLQAMEKLVAKFEGLTAVIKGVCDLELHQQGGDWDPLSLFQTWHTGKFYEISLELTQMFKKELSLKKTIVENLAHCNSRQLMMFYTSAWLHQPYIEDRVEMLLESMLLETGHR